MRYFLGISAGFHDAAASVVNSNGGIEFAAHSERYSRRKNDAELDPLLVHKLSEWPYDTVAFYERPWMHNIQQLISGQRQFGSWTGRGAIRKHLGNKITAPVQTYPQHLSNDSAGFQT